jgi:hypothetical protein
MDSEVNSGCTPDKCSSCTGCGGNIEKITLRVEWRHKEVPENLVKDVEESIFQLSGEMAVSGVELVYISNTFSPGISPGTSEFLINDAPLQTLTPLPEDGTISREVLRKGIFQALHQNI